MTTTPGCLSIRDRIQAAIAHSIQQPPEERVDSIRNALIAIQRDCIAAGRTFLFVEEQISCQHYGLDGVASETARLFRGPNPVASVMQIATDATGFVLHRDGDSWQLYKNTKDLYLKTPDPYACE